MKFKLKHLPPPPTHTHSLLWLLKFFLSHVLNRALNFSVCFIIFCTEDYDSLPCYKKAGQWICGIEKHDDVPKMTPEEEAAFEKKQLSIHESKWWKRVLNVNAIILMTLTVFLWGFYA